jgi:hypothetical protein
MGWSYNGVTMVVMMALSQLVQSTAQETLKMSLGIFFASD